MKEIKEQAMQTSERKRAKPEAETHLAFSKNSEEASMARAKRTRWSILADEFIEVPGAPLVQGFEGQSEL